MKEKYNPEDHIRKPTAKGIIIFDSKKRVRGKEREEIEEGIIEWENERKENDR